MVYFYVKKSMWKYYALLSALFDALTAILAKLGNIYTSSN